MSKPGLKSAPDAEEKTRPYYFTEWVEERHGKSFEVAFMATGDGQSMYASGGGNHCILAERVRAAMNQARVFAHPLVRLARSTQAVAPTPQCQWPWLDCEGQSIQHPSVFLQT